MTTFKTLLSAVLLASLSTNAGCGEVAKNDPPETTPDAAEPAKLQVEVTTAKLPILQGTSAELAVTITRLEGITGAVEITPVGLPDGVTADPLTIGADATTGTLKLYAAATAPHSLPTQVAVRGTIAGAAAMTDLTVTVYGAPGTLDTSFGGGRVMLPAGESDDYGNAVAVQPDGKIIIAGRGAENYTDFALVRVDRDGTVDTSFGNLGRVLTDFGGSDTIYAIALQPDGKIVVGGVTTTTATKSDFALARYLPNGQLDPDFGEQGKVTTVLGADADTAYALVIQSDGKIVLGGDSNRGGETGLDFALVRYLPNGSLDTDWSEDGIATAAIAGGNARDSVYALALQTINGQERIVAAGGEGDFLLTRFLPDGTIDNSFNFDSGTIQWIFNSTIGAARALAITPDNRIAVAGHSQHDFAVVRLTQDGYLDETFNDDGKLLTQVSTTNWDEAQAIAVEADGKLVVAGWAYEGGGSAGNFALVRYNTNGTLDTSFGGTGIVVTQVASGTKGDQAMAIAMQRDDRVPTLRIVTAGFASVSNSDFAVTRYWR